MISAPTERAATVPENLQTLKKVRATMIYFRCMIRKLLPGNTVAQGQNMTCCECGSVVVRQQNQCLQLLLLGI